MTIDEHFAQVLHDELPAAKETSLGLYVTAREAYEMWKAAPDKVNILDVRTPEEYYFIGHAEMARNIPLIFLQSQWDAAKNDLALAPNPDFVARATAAYSPADTILITCRSGGRSAWACNALAKAGCVHCYNIIDGMEGSTIKDPESFYDGKRMKNGWKNSGLPWTYELNPELMWLTEPT